MGSRAAELQTAEQHRGRSLSCRDGRSHRIDLASRGDRQPLGGRQPACARNVYYDGNILVLRTLGLRKGEGPFRFVGSGRVPERSRVDCPLITQGSARVN